MVLCLAAAALPNARAQAEAERGEASAADTAEESARDTADGVPTSADTTQRILAARRDIDAWVRELLAREDDFDDYGAGIPDADVAVGVLPPSLTSAAPPAPTPLGREATSAPELDWLVGAQLPDFAVRWDPRLYELLTYYREDARGQAQMKALLERSGRYETLIRRTFREAGLPEDLLYVALVESGYDATASSPAGAVGLWQFVKPTAADYELEVNRWVDERMSVELATRAAARFFSDLHGRLRSWPLTLAAYNMGYGAMLRAVRKYNSNDFWVLSKLEAGLPYETIAYVTKVMAAAIIAHNPERFGLADLNKDEPAAAMLVEVPGGVGLGRLARAASMSVEDLAALNPELLRKRVPPDVKTFALRVPAGKAATFKARWSDLAPRTGSHAHHVLRFGELLTDIAAMYGTTEARLRRLNGLSPDEEVRPGTRLLVPDVEPQPAPEGERPVVGVPDAPFRYPDRRHVFYRVLPGDRVEDVSRAFGVRPDELRLWNDISTSAALISGMYLQLFVPADTDLARTVALSPSQVDTLVVGSKEFFDYHEGQRDRVRIRYRVREGDSLASLASKYDLSVGSIARINGFSRYSELVPDREIILYVPQDRARQAKRR